MKTNPLTRWKTPSLWPRRAAILCAIGLLLAACNGANGPLVLSGTLETDDHDLIAPTTAQLIALRVAEGDRVTIGDTIGVLDTIAAAAAVRGAEGSLAEAEARLADLHAGSDLEKIRAAKAKVAIAEATLAQSERDLRRFDSLYTAKVIDARTQENAHLARDNAASSLQVAEEELADLRRGARIHQIEAADAAVTRARADYDARRRAFDQLFLIAAHNGIVQFLPYQTGEYVPAGRAAATIHDYDYLWVRIYIPEADLNRVAIGDTLSFAVDAHPEATYTGTVAHIAATAEFTPRNTQTPDERLNLVYAVKVIVTPGQEGLRAGMPTDFTIP